MCLMRLRVVRLRGFESVPDFVHDFLGETLKNVIDIGSAPGTRFKIWNPPQSLGSLETLPPQNFSVVLKVRFVPDKHYRRVV